MEKTLDIRPNNIRNGKYKFKKAYFHKLRSGEEYIWWIYSYKYKLTLPLFIESLFHLWNKYFLFRLSIKMPLF